MKTKLTKEQTEFLNSCIKRRYFQSSLPTWKLNSKTGLVNIDGNFDCSSKRLKDFKGIKFGIVYGDFNCSSNKLTSLEGAPQKVMNFDCSYNNLTSLEGAPQEVGRDFNCSINKLTSLVGAPQKVGRIFNCSYNKLTSLEGAPQQEIGWNFSGEKNPIPEEFLKMIWEKMQNGTTYYIALASLKSRLIKSRNKNVKELISQIKDDDLAKSASGLSKFGII